MKKSFVLLLALVLLVTGTACYAQNAIVKEKDQVHYTEKVILGDKSVVEGATVEIDASLEDVLFWYTTYKIGDAPEGATRHEFFPWYNHNIDFCYEGSMHFMLDHSQIIENGYDQDKEYTGLSKAVKELFDQTTPGEEKSTVVYLKDYQEYYTFRHELELPFDSEKNMNPYEDYSAVSLEDIKIDIMGLEALGKEMNNQHKQKVAEMKNYLKDVETFQEFFKIPVLDSEVYALSIGKGNHGEVSGMAVSHRYGGVSTGNLDFPESPLLDEADGFSLDISTTFDNGDCYMTFDPHTANGNLVDVSYIPGGYGIYHFTYDEKKGTIHLDELKMVYPLDLNITYSSIQLDASGKNLLLFSYDEKSHYLSVVDRETMKLVDSFELGNAQEYISTWTYEDFLVVKTDALFVFSLGETGRYVKEFSVDNDALARPEGEPEWGMSVIGSDSEFDWNGKTLIAVEESQILGADGLIDRLTCDFHVAAIDETGLLYYGKYESSLNTTYSEYNPCRIGPYAQIPLRIRWN